MLTRRRPQRQARSPGRGLAETLAAPRYEVLPLPGIEDEVARLLPGTATVTVTASPRRGLAATLDAAERLSAAGVRVVPHLSARLVSDTAHLTDVLDRLVGLGVHEVFVVGGDAEAPVGSFTGALDLLQAMDELGYEFVVGIAGYPEPHPKISDDVTVQAMWDKRRHASYIVSQVCFDPVVLLRWVERVRRRGVLLPIHVGIPGPASTRQLMRVSRRIGVGESARALVHHGTGVLRLAQPGLWRPDGLVNGLDPYLGAPGYGLLGLHIYTFNDIAAAEEWRRSRLAHVARA